MLLRGNHMQWRQRATQKTQLDGHNKHSAGNSFKWKKMNSLPPTPSVIVTRRCCLLVGCFWLAQRETATARRSALYKFFRLSLLAAPRACCTHRATPPAPPVAVAACGYLFRLLPQLVQAYRRHCSPLTPTSHSRWHMPHTLQLYSKNPTFSWVLKQVTLKLLTVNCTVEHKKQKNLQQRRPKA